MPTLNPRITITLTPATHAVLRALASATGSSQSAIVANLMEMATPVFERVVHAIEAAKQMEQSASHEIAAGLERAQEKLEGQLRVSLGEMDEAFRPLLEHAEKVQRRTRSPSPGEASGGAAPGRTRAAGRPGAVPPLAEAGRKVRPKGSTPVPVTRGSGSPPTSQPKGKRGGRGRL